MKTFYKLKLGCILVSLFFSFSSFAQPIYTLSGNLSGVDEVPPSGSSATGTISGSYNAATNSINIVVTFENLSSVAVAAHIHIGAGHVGPNIFPLSIPLATSGTATGEGVISETHEELLLTNGLYVHIHTDIFTLGEIGSFITATPEAVPTLGTWALIHLGLSLLCVGVVYIKHPIVARSSVKSGQN